MPRGYQDMYAEFVSVRRHILQVSASGEKDLLAKMMDHAKGDLVDGLQVSDDSVPLLFHDPHGSLSVGRNDDGPFMYGGNPFGEGTTWMRTLAAQLVARADEIDATTKEGDSRDG